MPGGLTTAEEEMEGHEMEKELEGGEGKDKKKKEKGLTFAIETHLLVFIGLVFVSVLSHFINLFVDRWFENFM